MAHPEHEAAAAPCAVIVTVDASAGVMPDLEAHARYGLTRFPEFAGFVSGTLHLSADGTRLVQYLRWRTRNDYDACINDPVWDDLPSTRRFMQLVGEGSARMEVRIYDVVAQAAPPSE